MFTGESHWLGNTLLLLRVRVKGLFCAGLTRQNKDLFQAYTECQSYKCEEYDAVCIGTEGIYCLSVHNPEERVKYYSEMLMSQLHT